MTRTVYYTATTLDGYIADEHDSLEWLFAHDIDPAGTNGYEDFMARVGAVVMGRTTYEWVRGHLLSAGETWPYAMPSWVITHAHLPGMADADIRFAEGPVEPIHAAMTAAAADLDLWVVGGGDLAGQFADAGLLDEMVVSIAPVTLGAGRPLFPRRHDLELVDLARNRSFACATYRVTKPEPGPGAHETAHTAGPALDAG